MQGQSLGGYTTLDSAGFIVHLTQCVWKPSQQCYSVYGPGLVVVDLALGPVQVPESKMVALQSMLEQAKCMPFVRASYMYLASMLGEDSLYEPGFGPS